MKASCTWRIEVSFGDRPLKEEADEVVKVYKQLNGSPFQPSTVLVDATGVGRAFMDYLIEQGVPCISK